MTLRTWGLLLIIGLFALIFSAHARAAEPGVFDQLRDSNGGEVRGRVENLSAQGDSFSFTLESTTDNERLALCPGTSAHAFMQVLTAAYETKRPVRLLLQGPFNRCVVAVRL